MYVYCTEMCVYIYIIYTHIYIIYIYHTHYVYNIEVRMSTNGIVISYIE